MKFQQILMCVLAFSLFTCCNGVGGFILLLMPAAVGMAKGVIKGGVGAFGPVAKDGLATMMDIFQNGLKGSLTAGNNVGHIGGDLTKELQTLSNNGLSGFGSTMQGLLGNLGQNYGQAASGSNNMLQSFLKVAMSMFKGFFKLFGSFSSKSKAEVGNMYFQISRSFDETLHEQLNPNKNTEVIKKEIEIVKEVLGSDHPDVNSLLKKLNENAPLISSSVKAAYSKAQETFKSTFQNMQPESKQNAEKLRLVLSKSKLSFGDAFRAMTSKMEREIKPEGTMSKMELGVMMNFLKNMLSMYKMMI